MLNTSEKPGRYCRNRLCEWTLALALFATGLELLVWPALMSNGMFHYLTDMVRPEYFAVVLLIVGFLRMLALLTNGGLPMAGPIIRSLGALMGASVWLEMALALARQAHDPSAGVTTIPVSIPLFVCLALSELVSTYRAAADANVRWT